MRLMVFGLVCGFGPVCVGPPVGLDADKCGSRPSWYSEPTGMAPDRSPFLQLSFVAAAACRSAFVSRTFRSDSHFPLFEMLRPTDLAVVSSTTSPRK